MRFKSRVPRLFVQQIIQSNKKRKRQRLALLVPCVRETTMAGAFLSHKASYGVLYISFAVSVTKLLNKSWGVSDLGLHDVHTSL